MGSGSDESAERRRLDREQQAAALGTWDFSRGKLEHARFVAHHAGFKQDKTGDIIITLVVPFEYREAAMGMLDAAGLPLSVDVVPWTRDASHPTHGTNGG